jgi:hypothetical protein
MVKDFGTRENSRVRDLVDLVILLEHNLLDPPRVAAAAWQVWRERDGTLPPAMLPPLPHRPLDEPVRPALTPICSRKVLLNDHFSQHKPRTNWCRRAAGPRAAGRRAGEGEGEGEAGG